MGQHRQNWCNGQTKEHGNASHCGNGTVPVGKSGTGYAYFTGSSAAANGGAGYLDDSQNLTDDSPKSFKNGLTGSSSQSSKVFSIFLTKVWICSTNFVLNISFYQQNLESKFCDLTKSI